MTKTTSKTSGGGERRRKEEAPNGTTPHAGGDALAPANGGAAKKPAVTIVVAVEEARAFSVRFRLSDRRAIDLLPVGCGSAEDILAARAAILAAMTATLGGTR